MTELWLIRHAEVEERFQGVFGGRLDILLSPRGQQQAAALASYLRPIAFGGLYASPMQRVQLTLAPMLGDSMPQPVILSELREVDFGDWTGLRFEEIESKYGVSVSAWLEQLERGAVPNAERIEALRARLEGCLAQILSKHIGERVAIVCHGGVIRGLLSILLKWPLSQMAAFKVDYTSITRVLLRPAEVRVQLLNFTPWRELGLAQRTS